MKYPKKKPGMRTVHLYCVVRVTVSNIKARNDAAAIEKAYDLAQPHDLFFNESTEHEHVSTIGFADEVQSALVDHDGDDEHRHSTTYVDDGNGWRAK